MTKVVADISMSLDGFVTGPEPDLEHGLGKGGEPLHIWAVSSNHEVDREVLRQGVERTGVVVMGRRLFDFVDGPHGWSGEMGYGARHAAAPPVIVVTHQPPKSVRLGPRFSFVTAGLAAAIDQAKSVAGPKDVVVMGGADVVRQAVTSGLADELLIHLAPVLLGAGTPLFPDCHPQGFEQITVRVSPFAIHVTYRVGHPNAKGKVPPARASVSGT